MTASPLMHDIPNMPVQRFMLTIMGSFVFFITPFELWRGVWPLNLFTPLFAVLVTFGMGLGATFIYGGLFTPSLEYELSPNGVLVKLQYLFGYSEIFHAVDSITGVKIEQVSSSDGPDDWYAVIGILGQKPLRSRQFGSNATAEDFAEQFRVALGLAN